MRRTTVVRTGTWLAIAVFLSAGWGGCVDDPFGGPARLTADTAKLKSSTVVITTDVPLAGRNVVWCATAQLAWDAACRAAGGDVQLAPAGEPIVAALNRHDVSAADLDPTAYVAVAGRVRDGVYGKIVKALADTFHGNVRPALLPKASLSDRPQDLVAYSLLFETLNFPVPFERLDDGTLQFAGATVAAFGMGEGKPHHERMAANVSVLDYRGPDDFVIELTTKSPADHLVLAKVTPGRTLAETVAAVARRRAAATPTAALPADVLVVPKMDFDLTRTLHELVGRSVLAPTALVVEGAALLHGEQTVRFRMNEVGVILQSETSMSIACSVAARPVPTHTMVFDKPFLLMLSRGASRPPYFAMWVATAELLETAEAR